MLKKKSPGTRLLFVLYELRGNNVMPLSYNSRFLLEINTSTDTVHEKVLRIYVVVLSVEWATRQGF